MMLDVHKDIVFFCLREKGQVVREGLGGGFGDEYMDAFLNGVESNGEVRCVGGKNGYGIPRGKGVDGFYVGGGVCGWGAGVGGEGDVEVVVDEGDVLVEVFT